MKIAIACGGTGGHIFPGLATADVLKSQGHEVILWLSGKDLEAEAVAGWDGDVITVKAEGFPGRLSLRGIRAAVRLLRAIWICRSIMRKQQPDVLLAMGSYASIGPAGAALLLRIPVVLHEANVLPGRAIALLSRWATAVAGCFEETRFYLKKKEIVLTGMPLRSDLMRHKDEPLPWKKPGVFTLLVMGGSRGARVLNEVVLHAVCVLHKKNIPLQVIHLTGHVDEDAMQSSYKACGVHHLVKAFSDDMGPIYAAADLAICRSGAATCAELSAFGVPALLIPYPYATHDHQMLNARALEKKNAVDVIREADLTEEWLVDYIQQCIDVPDRLVRMQTAMLRNAPHHAAESLAELVKESAI